MEYLVFGLTVIGVAARAAKVGKDIAHLSEMGG
jgi:hypothetical protein